MSLDLKESSITIRVPAYLKQQMMEDAKGMGVSMGEYIRAIMFSDMVLGYSYAGKTKIAKLRRAFEACDGVINSSQTQKIMGEPSAVNDTALDEIVKRGIRFLCSDKTSIEHQTIDDLVANTLESARKEAEAQRVVVEEAAEVPNPEPNPEATPEPEPVVEEQEVAPVQKPKRPKMGSTNALM